MINVNKILGKMLPRGNMGMRMGPIKVDKYGKNNDAVLYLVGDNDASIVMGNKKKTFKYDNKKSMKENQNVVFRWAKSQGIERLYDEENQKTIKL